MKGWVGLVGWPVADGLLTLVVTHQLQVERRTGKVRRPETDVLPLFHATNLSPYVYQFIQQYSAVASASELTVVVVSRYLCDDVMKDFTFLYCVYFIMHFTAFCAFRVVVLTSVLPAETPCWRSTTSCGSVSVCLSVCAWHKSEFCRNFWTDWAGFCHEVFLPRILHCIRTKLELCPINSVLRKFRHGASTIEMCCQLSSPKLDAQSVIDWTLSIYSWQCFSSCPENMHDNLVASCFCQILTDFPHPFTVKLNF